MYVNKVEPEKGELEIVYDVQWKTPGNDDDKAKIIGIVDTPDTNLDWNTFKSYLIQNSGNMRINNDDIKISYLDSDDDLIPIDSELEFRECLKFSRTRARRGRKIMMKVSMVPSAGAKPKDPSKYSEEYVDKRSKPKLFCLKKKDISNKLLLRKLPVNNGQDLKEAMPEWFEKYMTQFKTDLVQEITNAVVANIRSSSESNAPGVTCAKGRGLRNEGPSMAMPMSKGHHPVLHHVLEKRKKKKKISEEDSSDCTDGLQLQWEERLELLRHMQKINKREKKFEKKLDAKLEKLDSKTKKIMEKKHSLMGKKAGIFGLQPSASAPAPPTVSPPSEYLMNATPVDEYNYVPHVPPGEVITQVWKVKNNGPVAWTEETELRFAWGSKSLVPLANVVKCPPLQPGEIGFVKVTLQAPLFTGKFESYWHFHHQGRRFGHWLGCAVVIEQAQTKHFEQTHACAPACAPVDLTMKCPQPSYNMYDDNKISTTDDMKMYNIDIKPETMKVQQKETEPEIVASKDDKVDVELEEYPKLKSYIDVDSIFPDLVQMKIEASPGYEPDFNICIYLDNNTDANGGLVKEGAEIDEGVAEEALEVKIDNITTGINNVSLNEDNEKKTLDKEVVEEYNAYVSSSDSDNISIISGTVSDDTEPSDEFVVIPMTACVNCDKNTESFPIPVTQPITVEIPKSPNDSDLSAHSVEASDNNNNMEVKLYPNLSQAVLVPGGVEDPEKDKSKEDKLSDDENTVYVRDSFGNSIPVAKVLRFPRPDESPKIGCTIGHSTFGDPNFGHGPTGPRFPFGFGQEPSTSPPICHNPVGPCNFRPQHESPQCSAPYSVHVNRPGTANNEMFCSHFFHPEQQRCAFTNAGGRFAAAASNAGEQPECCGTFQNIYTEQPRPCNYSYMYQDGSKENFKSDNSGCNSTSSTSSKRDKPPATATAASVVQILPETLVTGAVNVASSAINTARSVIDMLRPRHEEPNVNQWEQIPSEVEQSLQVLSEMGFNNRELNIMLLANHNNSVPRVISELIP